MMNGGSEKLGIFLMKRQHPSILFIPFYGFILISPRTQSPLSLSAIFFAHPTQTSRGAGER
jgi:hypothetical protein